MKSGFYLITIMLGLVCLAACRVLGQNHSEKKNRQIEALIKEKQERTPAQRKIDSQLLQAIKEYKGKKMASGTTLSPANVDADTSSYIQVDISAVVSDSLLNKIKALGGQIIFPSKQYNTIRAQVHILTVETIAGYSDVKFIQPAVAAMHGSAANATGSVQGNLMKPPVREASDTIINRP